MPSRPQKPRFTPPPPRSGGLWPGWVTFLVGMMVVGLIWVGLKGYLWGPVVVVERCTAIASNNDYTLKATQTHNAATITAIAVERGLPARAATIALATARQESDLENINYGDRDSLGLFQQRPSQGWGTPEQVTDPVYAANKFYDGLVKIKGYETMVITEAADKVQRSAFPKAYADHEPEGRIFASALTGYSDKALSCRLKKHKGGPADAQKIANSLPHYAGTPTVDGQTITATVPATGQTGWAVAHFAVAQAKALGINTVSYNGYTWDRSKPDKKWFKNDKAAPNTVVLEAAS